MAVTTKKRKRIILRDSVKEINKMLEQYMNTTVYLFKCDEYSPRNKFDPTEIVKNINTVPAVIALETPALALIYYNDLTWNAGVKYGKISKDTWLMKLPMSKKSLMTHPVSIYGFDKAGFVRHGKTADPVYMLRDIARVIKVEHYDRYEIALKEYRVNVEFY